MRRIVFAVMIPVLAFSGWIHTYGTEKYGEVGRCARQTTDGGYIILADLYDENSDSRDLWLIKTDSLGDTLWAKTYGSNAHDVAYCIQQTLDGGYIISGFTNGDIWTGSADIWLLKTDAQGDTLWTRIYGGNSFDVGNWVEQTSEGGYILTSNYDKAYLLLLKTDEDGNTLWSHNYQWGSQQIETGYCIRQTADDGYVVATNMGLFKTDDKGDSLWLKPWAGHFVALTDDGGHFVLSGQNNDMWLIKTDGQGDTLWTRTYGGNDADAAWSVQQTTDSGYVIVGTTNSFGAGDHDAWLLKTDSLGDTIWTRTYATKGRACSVQQTSDGGYVFTGSTWVLGPGMGDVMLIKTDSLGYVGVKEEPPVQVKSNWQVISPIGPQITLHYTDRPQGFAASIFDATGRKVDEVHAPLPSGSITWGEGMSPGVYFVREKSDTTNTTCKVILIR